MRTPATNRTSIALKSAACMAPRDGWVTIRAQIGVMEGMKFEVKSRWDLTYLT